MIDTVTAGGHEASDVLRNSVVCHSFMAFSTYCSSYELVATVGRVVA